MGIDMAYHYTIAQWLLYFFIYCFIGWCFESTYVSLKKRRFVNRGFLMGPFLPIYGSGAIMMLVVSAPFQDNMIATYFAGLVGATALEYVTGVTMEALFKVRYWDYSNQKFNFQGHICLSSSLAWGAFTVLLTKWIHKPIERLVMKIPQGAVIAIVSVIGAILFVDLVISVKAALDLRAVLYKLEKAKQEMGLLKRRLDVVIAIANEENEQRKEQQKEQRGQWEQRIEERLTQMGFLGRSVFKRNPGMMSVRFKESMEELKSAAMKYRKKAEDGKNNGELHGEQKTGQ